MQQVFWDWESPLGWMRAGDCRLSVHLDGAGTVTPFPAWATCTAVHEAYQQQRSCSNGAVIFKKLFCDWIQIRKVLG